MFDYRFMYSLSIRLTDCLVGTALRWMTLNQANAKMATDNPVKRRESLNHNSTSYVSTFARRANFTLRYHHHCHLFSFMVLIFLYFCIFEKEYCDQFVCLSVCGSICLSVCLSVWEHISGTAGPIFTKLLCRSPVGWLGPPRAALRYVMYFWFMDLVTFGRNGSYGDAWKAEPLTYYH